jgi:hypothetical protein
MNWKGEAMIENCPMRHENGNCIPAGGFCTANKNICEALLNAYRMGKAQLSKEGTIKDATSDLISRTETVEHLRRMLEATVPNTDYDEGFIDGVEFGISTVSTMPTIQPEPQWIPVSERLPETEEFVLASLTGKYRNTTFEHACEIADYADGEWCVYAYPHMSAEKCEELIEAWMPLPEPYKPNNK